MNKVDLFVWLLQMSEVVGFDIKPEATTSLCNMLEYNLHKHTEKWVLNYHSRTSCWGERHAYP